MSPMIRRRPVPDPHLALQQRQQRAAVEPQPYEHRHAADHQDRRRAGVFRRTGQRVGVRLNEVDYVLETRVEQLRGEDEPDRQREDDPVRKREAQQHGEADGDQRQQQLSAKVGLVDERLPDSVDRVRDGVRERACIQDRILFSSFLATPYIDAASLGRRWSCPHKCSVP